MADVSVLIALPSAPKRGYGLYPKGPEHQGNWPFAVSNGLTRNSHLSHQLNCSFYGSDGEEKGAGQIFFQ